MGPMAQRCASPEYEFRAVRRPPLARTDAFLPSGWRGRALYQYRLEPDGRIVEVNLKLLDVYDAAGSSVVTFTRRFILGRLEAYPLSVLPYVPWLLDHATGYRFQYAGHPSCKPVTDGANRVVRFFEREGRVYFV